MLIYSSSKASAKRTNKGKYGKKFSWVVFLNSTTSTPTYFSFFIVHRTPKIPNPIITRLREIIIPFVILNDKLPLIISSSSLTTTRKYRGMNELRYRQISLKSFIFLFLTLKNLIFTIDKWNLVFIIKLTKGEKMANKYNSKKKTLLGSYLKTPFEGDQKPTLRYANVEANWRELEENKSAEQHNEDLLKFSYFGNKKRVSIALSKGANINSVDKNNNNALILAVFSRDYELVKFLANYHKDEKGRIIEDIQPIDVNWKNKDGISALHLAIKLKNFRFARILLEAGVDPNLSDKYGETPIFNAVKEDQPDLIELLLSYGANVNHKNREGQTPVIVASQNKNRQQALLSLIKNGADLTLNDNKNRNPLMHAANNDNGAMMDIILRAVKYDQDYINHVDINHVSTLMICAKRGSREGVRVLLSRGANPFLLDKNGKSASDGAIKNGHHTCHEIIEKAKRIYIASEQIENEDQREKFLKIELGKIGQQNRVQNSCVK